MADTKNNSSNDDDSPKIIQFSDIERITQTESFDSILVDAIAQGFVDFSSGKFNVCPIQTMGAPPMAPFSVKTNDQDVNVADHLYDDNNNNNDNNNYSAQVCIKSGYITDDPYFTVKVASGGHPLQNSGLMQLYSQRTGTLQALLLDEGILTELRTAAAGAVAIQYLGPSQIQNIGIVGTGIQARYQLRYVKQVTDCRNVLLWGRTREKTEALKKELDDGWNVEIADTTQQLLDTCNIIITTTCAREALLDGPVTGPLLIICIGADSVGKQELSVDLVSNAETLVCDAILQTQERGEFQHAIRESMVQVKNIHEIGHIIKNGVKPGNNVLTIFDSSGVAVQDCVVAKIVYEQLLA